MSQPPLTRRMYERFLRKVRGIVPILVGAAVLVGAFMLVLYFVTPFLPEPYQRVLHEMQAADWAQSGESLKRFFEGFGPAMPYAFLSIQVLQVIFAPIPGQLVGLLGGYLFGFWKGLFITMLGLGIGSAIAMGLGRLLGERLIRRVVPAGVIARFDHLVAEGALWNFFMLFLLPALPDDAICFMAGLTRLPLSRLVAVCVLGRLPGMAVLTFVGVSVGTPSVWANLVLAVAMIAALFLWLFSDEAEEYFYRLSQRVRAGNRPKA